MLVADHSLCLVSVHFKARAAEGIHEEVEGILEPLAVPSRHEGVISISQEETILDGVSNAIMGNAAVVVHHKGEPVVVGLVEFKEAASKGGDAALDKATFLGDDRAVETTLAGDHVLLGRVGLY